ncbi:MAG TPA: ankyrin repeat domain-containing protein, partial [Vicinamibacteria bacterium]|nr:ankyrin repeat domain-containing protein [Vicinamibacteria bacterium]
MRRSGQTVPAPRSAAALLLLLPFTLPAAPARASEQELLRAVRAGDVAAVKALLDKGVPVDTRFRYDRTALSFAADRGQAEMVTLLLDRGADVDAEDSFYKVTPLFWAADHSHVEVVRILLARGARGVEGVLRAGVDNKSLDLVRAALGKGDLDPDELSSALEQAEAAAQAEIAIALRAGGAVLPPRGDFALDGAVLARYAGTYQETEGAKQTLVLSVQGPALQAVLSGPPLVLGAIDAVTF